MLRASCKGLMRDDVPKCGAAHHLQDEVAKGGRGVENRTALCCRSKGGDQALALPHHQRRVVVKATVIAHAEFGFELLAKFAQMAALGAFCFEGYQVDGSDCCGVQPKFCSTQSTCHILAGGNNFTCLAWERLLCQAAFMLRQYSFLRCT
jgi:hypothetical protein